MAIPPAVPRPLPGPPFFFSLGMKMLALFSLLLVLSFGLCSLALLAITRHMVQDNLQTMEIRSAPGPGAPSLTGTREPRVLQLAREVLRRPEILARAGDWLLVALCGTLILFVLIFLAANEVILARPFRRLLASIDSAGPTQNLTPLRAPPGNDEWGVLAARLNRFVSDVIDLREQSKVLHETSRLLGLPWELKGALEEIMAGLLHRHNLSSCLVFSPVDGNELRVRYSSGISESLAEKLAMRLGQGAGGIAYASATQRLIPDLTTTDTHDPLLHEMAQRQQIRSALFVPMQGNGHAAGVTAYFSRSPNNFSDPCISSLTLFTRQLAVAVHNALLMSQLKDFNKGLESEVAMASAELTTTNRRLIRKVRELKTIYDLALATAASANVEEIVQVIINAVKELVDVTAAAFFLYDRTSGLLQPLKPAFDYDPDRTPALAFRLEDSKILERVIRDGLPLILNFVDPMEQLPASWTDAAIRSIMVLPLRQGEQVAGLFCVVNKTNGLFSDDDQRLVSLLTSRVTEVLNRLGMDQQLRQKVQDLSVLQDIALHLPSPPVLGETVNAIARISRAALKGADVCLFFLHHVESEALAVMGGDWDAKLELDPKALTLGVSEKLPVVDVFRDSQIAYYGASSSASGWDKDELVQLLKLQEVLYLPLRVEHQTIGVMALACLQKGMLTAEHHRLAGLIAEHVSVMIERSRLYERLRSANEKLQQINRLKNEFISMVSHELRTPLTTIKGYVSIVLSGEAGALKAQQRYFLDTSDRAIDRLTLLVSDLLDISRLEAGHIQMQLRPVSLKDVVERVRVNFAPQVKAQGLTFEVKIPDHIPFLLADPNRLIQIFDNLISNSLKFTAKGGITVTAADKGDFVMVSVKDTGIGLPPGELDRIFEKFYQVKVGSAWPSKGTGLGLAIVKSIVESHRGKVWVESDPGKGADFRFLIPRARTESLTEGALPMSGKLL